MYSEGFLEPLFQFDLPPPIPADAIDLIDVSKYYGYEQKKVADLFGMSVSTFSKRWRIASNGRLWPYRRVKVIDKELKVTKDNAKIANLNIERKRLLKAVKVYISMR